MVKFNYAGKEYVFSDGFIKPATAASLSLMDLYKDHVVGSSVPDSELDFIQSLGIEVIEYAPDETIKGAIYG